MKYSFYDNNDYKPEKFCMKMIILQYPVKLREHYLTIRKIERKKKRGKEIMLEDWMEYYQAKANIFFKISVNLKYPCLSKCLKFNIFASIFFYQIPNHSIKN